MRSGSGSTRTTRGCPPMTCTRLARLDLGELLRQLGGERPQRVARPALAPEGERQERHVVDRVQLHDRRQRALRNDPADRGLASYTLTRLSSFDSPTRKRTVTSASRARRGVDVLDAGDAPHDPLDGDDDPALDLGRLGARPGHHHVHHGHADLRLFLTGSREERERAEAQRGRDQEGRELAVDEGAGDPAREPTRMAYPASPERAGIAPSLGRCSSSTASVDEARGLEHDALACLDAGPDLDAVAVARACGHPAQSRVGVAHDEEPGEAAPLEERGGGSRQAGIRGDARNQQAREQPGPQTGGPGQVGLQLEAVRRRVPGRRDGGDRGRERGRLAVHHGPQLRPGTQRRGELGLDRRAQLQPALALDLDQRHAGVHDVAEVDASRGHAPREGGPQRRVGQVVLRARELGPRAARRGGDLLELTRRGGALLQERLRAREVGLDRREAGLGRRDRGPQRRVVEANHDGTRRDPLTLLVRQLGHRGRHAGGQRRALPGLNRRRHRDLAHSAAADDLDGPHVLRRARRGLLRLLGLRGRHRRRARGPG